MPTGHQISETTSKWRDEAKVETFPRHSTRRNKSRGVRRPRAAADKSHSADVAYTRHQSATKKLTGKYEPIWSAPSDAELAANRAAHHAFAHHHAARHYALANEQAHRKGGRSRRTRRRMTRKH